jgi:transcriptional regulator with XRE-family HTH domain
MTIGEKTRAWRVKRKLSQTELAASMRVKPSLVSMFESGDRYLGEYSAKALETATGGDIRAIDCVRPEKRQAFRELMRGSA